MMPKIDHDLLFIASEHARMKLNSIARQLRRSPQRVNYSISILEKEKIMQEPYCITDYSYFGLMLFRVYFKGGYGDESDKEHIISSLQKNPYVVSIYELSGEFDLVIEMQAPNASRFNKEFKKLTYELPTLNHYKIVLNIVSHLYPRMYLLNSPSLAAGDPEEIIIGGDREIQQFSEQESALLKELLIAPRAPMTTLAHHSDMNVKTATQVLKELMERRVVKGWKHIINTERLGVHRFRLFLELHNLSQEREQQLMLFLHKNKFIIQVHKTVGDWDLEVDIESFNRNAIRQLVVGLRSAFKDIIQTFNIMEFYEYYKISYLPAMLFAPADH